VVAPAPVAAEAGAGNGQVAGGWLDRVGMNQIQTINTHNSYKRETSLAEQAAHDQIRNDPANNYAVNIGYRHASLPDQLEDQNVRGIELDRTGRCPRWAPLWDLPAPGGVRRRRWR
jgi:Phosphoinositide phospholipase C, Ca2+-dependent